MMYWEANQFNKTGSFQPKEIGSQKNRVEGGYCTKISSSKLQLFTFVDWLILLLFSILHKWPFQQFETIFIIYSYCINKIKLSFSKKATKNFRYLILYFLKLRLINVCSVHNFDTKFTRGGQKYVHFHSIHNQKSK